MLPDVQKKYNALPEHIKDKVDFSASLAEATAEGWNEEPLPDGYMPQCVNLYVNGDNESCFDVIEGQVTFINDDFYALDRTASTYVIEIDAIARYVQVHGEVILDSTGGTLLPEALVLPESQISLILNTIQKRK